MYNEDSHIEKSLFTIVEIVRQAITSFEVIVVDDGSRDGTWTALQTLLPRISELKALRLSRNFGKELALCAGLEHAVGRAVIVMDGDLQHPPNLIPEMIRLWREEKYAIVECVKESRGKEPLLKKIGATLFYGTLNRLTGYNLKNASDFKLLDAIVVQAWRGLQERNTFFRGMTAWVGFRKTTIPFRVMPREHGTSRWGFIKLARLAVESIVSFSTIPLRLVSLLGIVFSIGAITLGIHTVWKKLFGGAVTGFTTVILLQLIIGGLLMISIGIVGEYISAIYHEVKGRPRYLISEKISNSEGQSQIEVDSYGF
ncbi:glycosyltransferase family 2 protein [Cohnella sp. NL03-T5]|nr:glycosyltransferase family 2 protein [Cohnella silvisoli]